MTTSRMNRMKTVREAFAPSLITLTEKESDWVRQKALKPRLDEYLRTGRAVVVVDDPHDRQTLKTICDRIHPGGCLVMLTSEDAKH